MRRGIAVISIEDHNTYNCIVFFFLVMKTMITVTIMIALAMMIPNDRRNSND